MTGAAPMSKEGCLFCAIVAGAVPASVVAEDDRTVAFMDISPVTPGHTLVVPRHHADALLDASPDDVAAVARMAQRVAAAAVAELSADGVNLFQATGAAAFQTVFHLHVHVLPRHAGDDFRLTFDRPVTARAELDAMADRLRGRLGAP